MKKNLILTFIATVLCSLGLIAAQPVSALETENPSGIFTVESDDEGAAVRFGRNVLFAGNNLDLTNRNGGLLFSFGNQLGFQTESEYAFIAGNTIDFAGKVKHDTFIAGNSITLAEDAEIGRDVFATGNIIKVNTDLPGNLAACGNKVTLNGIKIDGDVNLDVDTLTIEGEVAIKGKLVVNDDADIIGLSHVTYSEIERYTVVTDFEVSASAILILKLISISGLFITMVIFLALFPRIGRKVAHELNALQFGKDLLIGLGVLVFVPFISVFLLISIFGAPAGIILLAAYLIMIYLAQAFSGLWLGKLLIEKAMHFKGNNFIEAMLGIVILGFAVMVPVIGWTIGLVSLVLGLGLMMQCLRSKRSHKTDNAAVDAGSEVEEAEVITESETKVTSSNDSDKQPSDTSKTSKKKSSTDQTTKE